MVDVLCDFVKLLTSSQIYNAHFLLKNLTSREKNRSELLKRGKGFSFRF